MSGEAHYMRDLTPEEQAQLEAMTQGDVVKPKYTWDDTFQKKLLGMLLTDSFMLVQAADKIKPEYFTHEAHVLVCKLLMAYFNTRKAIPPRFVLQQEMEQALKERESSIRLGHLAEFESLYDYYVPALDTRDYLLDKVTYFAKVQAVKIAFHNCLEKMQAAPEDEKTWSFVYESMRSAMSIEKNYEPGLEYFNNIEEMFRRMEEVFLGKDRFTTGFPSIDFALTGGGLFPGQIGSWIGLPGTGKSLALVKAAVANVMLGHKVLYLTMEMDELGISQRFTSQFAKRNINALRENKDDIIREIEEFKRDKADPNLLHIKQFPGGMLDVNGIRAYVSQLELRGWKPNLIIVDYVGEMKDDPNVKKYESAYRILRDLRGFGVEKQHCTLTCVQPNSSAAKLEIGQFIDESNIGTSFDQFKPLDAFWSLNQQVIEKEAEVARVFVIKHRNGKSRFAFKIGVDYRQGTLDLFEITKDRYREKMNLVQEKKAEEVSMDNVEAPQKKQRSKKGFVEADDQENNYEA